MAKGGYRGGFSGGSQANMMRQAQKMQQELLKMQQELETTEFEFTAGGGAVKAVVMGSRQLKAIEIDPDAVDPEDVEMLQDLIVAAVNGAMKLYEEKRAPFIERNKILKSLTSNDAKLESIKDYISMPALPYYIFGSENILEVNSMDETDSYRKCRKAHKSVLSLSCILFPELLSRDGENTIYCTDLEYKDYGNYVSELE